MQAHLLMQPLSRTCAPLCRESLRPGGGLHHHCSTPDGAHHSVARVVLAGRRERLRHAGSCPESPSSTDAPRQPAAAVKSISPIPTSTRCAAACGGANGFSTSASCAADALPIAAASHVEFPAAEASEATTEAA